LGDRHARRDPRCARLPVVDAWIHRADLVVAGLLDAEDVAK
jgi:hypothetical protein